jgi:ATP-dependent Zn protease
MTDEHLTALHESAHAVIAVMTGMDVSCVVLHAAGSSQTEAGRCELHDWAAERDADVERFLAFMLAGRGAEYRAVGRHGERGAGDWKQAVALAAVALKTESESPHVAELLAVAQVHIDAVMADAAVWGWIQRTARALVTRRRLSGRDVQLLLEAR